MVFDSGENSKRAVGSAPSARTGRPQAYLDGVPRMTECVQAGNHRDEDLLSGARIAAVLLQILDALPLFLYPCIDLRDQFIGHVKMALLDAYAVMHGGRLARGVPRRPGRAFQKA